MEVNQEYVVVSGIQTVLQRLLHAALLLRNRDYFVHRYGPGLYEQALGDAQWLPFEMLGKLMSVAHLLRREATDRGEWEP